MNLREGDEGREGFGVGVEQRGVGDVGKGGGEVRGREDRRWYSESSCTDSSSCWLE